MARMMPCSTPQAKTTTAVTHAMRNSLTRAARMRAQPLDVDQSEADHEHDRGEHRLGHVGEEPGEEQHDDEHDERHRDVRELGAAALLVEDLGLRRAAVDDERAREAGGDVRAAESEDVAIDVDALVVLHREAARGGGALRDDQEEARERDAQHGGIRRKVDARREPDGREPALHRADHRHPVARRVEHVRQDDRQDHRDHGAGDLAADEPLATHDDHQRARRERDGPARSRRRGS